MCFASSPKQIETPPPPLPPKQEFVKPPKVERGKKRVTSKKGGLRKRGTGRGDLVIPRTGVNKPSSGGVGIYG